MCLQLHIHMFRKRDETDSWNVPNDNAKDWGPKSCFRENHVLTIMVSVMGMSS